MAGGEPAGFDAGFDTGSDAAAEPTPCGAGAALHRDPRRAAKANLVRFVVGPDEAVVPDVEGKLPGGGLWVTADRAVLEQGGGEERLRPGRAPEGPGTGTIWSTGSTPSWSDGWCSCLSLARGAGDAVAGFVKVEERLRASRDAAAGGGEARHGRVAPGVRRARRGGRRTAKDRRAGGRGWSAGGGCPGRRRLGACVRTRGLW